MYGVMLFGLNKTPQIITNIHSGNYIKEIEKYYASSVEFKIDKDF